jgi:adenylate kinase family enzyme
VTGLRIHIIGGSGTGKTFLAKKLGSRLALPVLDLDEIFWSPSANANDVRASEPERDSSLLNFTQRGGWIIEGVYYRWLLPSFEAASHIIVLTPPLWLRQTRIIQRFIRRRLGLESGKKESFRDIRQLLAWNRGYDRDNLARAFAMLDEKRLPYTICASPTDVDALLRHD